ncbi:type I 3-dehydroquinate dehydratase [Leptospira barantonii]|uniref:3-dehydroquinate dehydratase n=1 Tax=Leptospira barantonii TaxID=2023184 RepID=A0A5F2BSD0_9LEPT|nr:type I 3-dehydroquinate dehydratase [Leptospira barantonii]TGM08870.1 type I 3-dehydroquinate dehydratase [Leptospira barantonii]
MNPREFKIVLTVSENEFFSLEEHPNSDWIEIRLDLFSPESIAQKLPDKIKALNARCVFTYRQAGDTDQNASAKENEFDFNSIVSQLDPKDHYLDLELNRPNGIFDSHTGKGFGLIRSVHKFNGILTEEEIRNWIQKDPYLAGTKKYAGTLPLIYKFAVYPNSISELTEFLSSFRKIANDFRKLNVFLTGICMGQMGVISRVFPDSFGSIFTYCCLTEPKAPGQVDINSLLELRNQD